jgi:hypothetical protein
MMLVAAMHIVKGKMKHIDKFVYNLLSRQKLLLAYEDRMAYQGLLYNCFLYADLINCITVHIKEFLHCLNVYFGITKK